MCYPNKYPTLHPPGLFRFGEIHNDIGNRVRSLGNLPTNLITRVSLHVYHLKVTYCNETIAIGVKSLTSFTDFGVITLHSCLTWTPSRLPVVALNNPRLLDDLQISKQVIAHQSTTFSYH